MADVALGSLSAHVLLAGLGFSLLGLAVLAAVPGIVMIKRRSELPTALLGFACGMILSGAITLILSTLLPGVM